MMQSGIHDDFKRHYKKIKIGFIVSLVLSVISIIVNVISIMPEESLVDLYIISVFAIIFSLFAWALFGIRYIRIYRYKNIVGENLEFDITEQGIKIQDNIDGQTIEKSFTWSDIDYINKVCYTSYSAMEKYFYGLEFVIDEAEFHGALAKRQKQPEYNQRDDELNYGFFILCEKDYAYTVEDYWGKEIR